MPKYKKVPMSHQFLTGMECACRPLVRGPKWDCPPYNQDMVNRVTAAEKAGDEPQEGSQAKKDLNRTPWYFGEKRVIKGSTVRKGEEQVRSMVMPEKRAVFKSLADLKLYSWLVPERQVEGENQLDSISLEEALHDKKSLAQLMQKAADLEQRLKEQEQRLENAGLKIEEKPAAFEKVDHFLKSAASSTESKQEELNMRSEVEAVVAWIEQGQKKLSAIGYSQEEKSGNQESKRNLDLSAEESQALLAFSVSVGDGVVAQAGCVRGVEAGCFETGWLTDSYGINTRGRGRYEEGNRLERLPDGRIKMSSYLQLKQFSELTSAEKAVGKLYIDDPAIKISSEQIFEQRTDSNGKAIYTMTPENQVVEIEEDFWQVMVARANAKLNKIRENGEVIRPSDFFAIIPFLEDSSVRDNFYLAMEKQPDFAFEFGKKWVAQYCSGDPSLVPMGTQVFDKLDAIKAAPSAEKEKRLIRNPPSLEGFNDYVGYIYDSSCEREFRQLANKEFRNLENEHAKAIINDMKASSAKSAWGSKGDELVTDFQDTINANLKDRLKVRLKEIEKKGEVITPSEIDDIIPLLGQDKEFKALFGKVMAGQPDFVGHYVTDKLYKSYTVAEAARMTMELEMQNVAMGSRRKEKPSISKVSQSIEKYAGYFKNPSSAKSFREALRQELRSSNKEGHADAIKNIKKIRTELNFAEREILTSFIRLDEIEQKKEVLTPADVTTMVKHLKQNEDLQKLFCAAMAGQPDFVIDFAKKQIVAKYKENEADIAFSQEMFKKLDQANKAYLNSKASRGKDKPSMPSVGEYIDYFNDPISATRFRDAVIQDLHSPKKDGYTKAISEIKDNSDSDMPRLKKDVLSAFIRLDEIQQKNEILKPSEVVAMVALLKHDKDLQKVFCSVIAKQPDFVVDFANKQIVSNLNIDSDERQLALSLCSQLDTDRKALAAPSEKDKPKLITSRTSIKPYLYYAADTNSETSFRESLLKEMKKLKRDDYEAVVAEIKKTPGLERFQAHIPPYSRSSVLGIKDMLRRSPSSVNVTQTTTIAAIAVEGKKEEVSPQAPSSSQSEHSPHEGSPPASLPGLTRRGS